jgi:hypothetical protein
MATDAFKNWNARTTVIARVFLATTLLLRTFDWIPDATIYAKLVFSFELLLGAAIAVGWLMRYAAAIVFLGTLAAVALTSYFHLVLLPAHPGTIASLLIASGILVCLGPSSDKVDPAFIDENNKSSSEHSCGLPHGFKDEDVEVTIRLEDGYLRGLWKNRCIVTIHDRAGGVQSTGQEAWYARENS